MSNAIPAPTDAATLAQVTAAAKHAAGVLARSSDAERARWLRAVADALDAEVEELVAIADEETSLRDTRLRGEVVRTSAQLRMFAGVLDDGGYLEATIDHADAQATPPRPDLRRLLVPLGPVGVFAASNFPFAFSVAGGDTASALAAGCPVVVKAHPGHPRLSVRTAAIVERALEEAHAPEGSFALVEGYEVGRDIVLDPAIKAVGFTGSLQGGRALFDLAMARPDPIPFYGELGSLNPVVLTAASVLTRADELAHGLVESFTLGVGQFCTKPGIVFVPAGGGFEDAVSAQLGERPSVAMLNEDIATRFGAGLQPMATDGRVEVIAGDPSQDVTSGSGAPVVLVTSADELTDVSDALLRECFGPVTLLVRYESQQELKRGLAALPGSLTASLHLEDGEVGEVGSIVERLRELSGRVVVNGWPTGVAVAWAQQHGGPWPATTASLHTSVGATAIRRFLRPVAYQDAPQALLPAALRDDNPRCIPRRVDGRLEAP